MRIANTDEAIVYADPIIVETELFEKDFTAVSATSASIPLKITNPDVENPMLQYRASGPALGNQFLCHSREPILPRLSRSAVLHRLLFTNTDL